MAGMKIGVMALVLLGLAGCGPSESEYEELVREGHALMNRLPGVTIGEAEVAAEISRFRQLSSAEQREEIRQAREAIGNLRQDIRE